MEKMLIGLCGVAGSGKDTIADHLVKKYGFVKMANADLLKRMAQLAFDFTDDQLWGPSELRNAPDHRYPREHGPLVTGIGAHGCCACCGWDIDSNPDFSPSGPKCYLTPRFALQSLGTEWGRMCFENIWVGRLLGIAQELLARKSEYTGYDAKKGITLRLTPVVVRGVVISDVRFLNEVDAIKAAGGKIVRVVRGMSDLLDQHPAEGGWVSEHKLEGTGPSIVLQESTSVSTAAAQHQSETELFGISKEKFDYLFQNNGDLHLLGLNSDRMMDVFRGRVMAFDRGLQDAPPFLREKCKALALFMSELSQKYYEQDWADILPYSLWNALNDAGNLMQKGETRICLTDEDLAKLKELSDATPGWFTWEDKTYDAPYFVRRGPWFEMYEKFLMSCKG